MKVLYNRITHKISQNSFLLDYVILRLPKNQIVTSIHALAFCHALPLFAHEILMQCMCTRCFWRVVAALVGFRGKGVSLSCLLLVVCSDLLKGSGRRLSRKVLSVFVTAA